MSGKDQKEQLVKHLNGGEAFVPVDHLLDKIPFEKLGEKPHNLPYSFYQLFYHIVFAQKDILEFSISGSYKTSKWPDDYWPKDSAPADPESWEALKKDYFDDREIFEKFILDPKNDLDQLVKNSKEHTVHREILLVIEHTAYHTGQMIIILRLLGLYK
ncbi:DinB family protein [Salegentibacter sp. Hel_I_6]|uniref:DinB family protein n=1 Tax=Salegentibacter sp. Hel_I_6 TaxID=1250278 RepID=UPI00055EFA90|nr:DinB family protein [Salegentibacter sp. Hel_I_6]